LIKPGKNRGWILGLVVSPVVENVAVVHIHRDDTETRLSQCSVETSITNS
jgi:hypothetical protein